MTEDGGRIPLREVASTVAKAMVDTSAGQATDDERWPSSVDARIGDVTDKSAVQSAMHGVDAVIPLAALLHIVNPPPELREKYERINVGGTATVVEAAIKAGVKRVVLASTIAVEGQRIQKELGFVPQYDLNAGWQGVRLEEDDRRRTPLRDSPGRSAPAEPGRDGERATPRHAPD